MPELPEVEVTRIGIIPHITGNTISAVKVYNRNLRWPITPELISLLPGQIIQNVERRGKHLLLHCQAGVLLIHLGMTGYMRIVNTAADSDPHDHFDLVFMNDITLRLNDVRRFSSVLWAGADPYVHKFLSGLGPEPLTNDFNGAYLYKKSRSSKVIIKQFIMDSKIVAGVGNIYANESLFHAGIRPTMPAERLSKTKSVNLAAAIKSVLTNAINHGGTMLDFRDGTEKRGYFHQELAVYRRNGKPCRVCDTLIQQTKVGRRSIYYCVTCQH